MDKIIVTGGAKGIGKVYSTNRRFLDAYDGADGIKTGYTSAAGFNLVGSAKRGNKRIIATVFGGTSTAQRNAKVAELLDLGFGRAPGNVREEKPQPPQYLAEAPSGAPAPGSSAKTIRVAGAALVVSPRPAARPTIALPETDTDAIMAAVALAQTPKTPAPDTTEAVAAALATPAEAAEAPAIVLAEAPDALKVSPRPMAAPRKEAAPVAEAPVVMAEAAPQASPVMPTAKPASRWRRRCRACSCARPPATRRPTTTASVLSTGPCAGAPRRPRACGFWPCPSPPP